MEMTLELGSSSAPAPTAANPSSTTAPTTLSDLLQALAGDSFFSKYAGMLQSTARRISEFLNIPLNQIERDKLVGVRPSFRVYLKSRKYKLNSIRSYLNYLAILTAGAKHLGWTPAGPHVSAAWKEISDAMPLPGCRRLVQYAIGLKKLPAEFTEANLSAYLDQLRDSGISYSYTVAIERSFRRAICTKGLTKLLPGIACSVERKDYGVSLLAMPEPLRKQVENLLQWKQAKYAPGRGKQIRPVTARNLQYVISRIYGFVRNVQGHIYVNSLAELVTEESILAFINWSINERGLEGYSLASMLRLLHAALRGYPATKYLDFKWFPAAIADLPRPNQSEIQARKVERYVDREILINIPVLMRAERKAAAKQGGLALARLVHDELLISWLLALPWRQLNLRSCRIGGKDPNLFKGPIPPLVNMAIPSWVQERIKANPKEPIWQFCFREVETKTGKARRGILLKLLVAPLEEYLEHYRPSLLYGCDSGTLFLNREGGELTTGQMSDLIQRITWKYTKHRVNAHLFRDIFVFWWLQHHPEDYLTLSKLLWHSNIQTTINIYGSKFDESAALCRFEEYFERGGMAQPAAGVAVDKSFPALD